MIHGKSCVGETHYAVLSSREDATHDELRASYRSAALNTHPDKSRSSGNEPGDRFFKVQKAWEVLGDSHSRALYDNQLRASRRSDAASAAEDVGLDDMTVEDDGGRGAFVELYYQCRCGDCFSVDSIELGKMGYELSRDGDMVCVQTADSLPASVLLPCGSCSLKVRLLIDPTICVSVGSDL